MVSVKSLILLAAFLFFQGAQSFCIYNRLTSGSFEIVQMFSERVPNKFKKHMKVGQIECCHYSNRVCSPNGLNSTYTEFYVKFVDWPAYDGITYSITCTTGGALSIRGSEEKPYAFCTQADGFAYNTTVYKEH